MSEKEQILQPLNKNFKEPKLRFKEFNKSYYYGRLQDVVTEITRRNNNYDYPIMMISASKGFINQSEKYSTDNAGTSKSKYIHLKKGELAYNHGNSKVKKYGAVFMLEEENALVPFVYHCFSLDKKQSSKYWAYYLNTIRHDRYLRKIVCSTARLDGLLNISSEDYFKMPVHYPGLEEQNKVTIFLDLIYRKIELLEAKISILKKYKEGIMFRAFIEAQCRTFKLEELTSNNTITLGRGNIIPKQKGIYPVYSSSAQNNGLFCYKNDYMFDEELVTWSVDGGGRPFIRKKHKFSITNVCGFAKINNNNIVNYWWLYICFWNNWKSINFDYTTKAHPSVIDQLYKIKLPTIDYQIKYSTILDKIESILKINNECLFALNKLKKQLMKDLFL